MSPRARTLALGLLLAATGVAQAGWNLYLIHPMQRPATVDEFRQAMLKSYGTEAPELDDDVDVINPFTLPGNFIKKPGLRFSSVQSFEFEGVAVHLYQNRNNVMSEDVTALSIDDEDLEWLWPKLTDADGDGIADGWIKPGGEALIEAFQRTLAGTEEEAAIQEYAVTAFRNLIATSALHDMDMDHPWVEEGSQVLSSGLDLSWSMTATDKGRGERLAERAMERLSEALFGR